MNFKHFESRPGCASTFNEKLCDRPLSNDTSFQFVINQKVQTIKKILEKENIKPRDAADAKVQPENYQPKQMHFQISRPLKAQEETKKIKLLTIKVH